MTSIAVQANLACPRPSLSRRLIAMVTARGQRRRLTRLEPWQQRELGLTEADIRAEAERMISNIGGGQR